MKYKLFKSHIYTFFAGLFSGSPAGKINGPDIPP